MPSRSLFLLQPVLSEFYDELIFNEPTEFFYKKLMAGQSTRSTRGRAKHSTHRFCIVPCLVCGQGPDKEAPPHPLQEHFPTYSDVAVLKTLADAQQFVSQEIQETKDLLLNADIELKELKDRIQEYTKKKRIAERSASGTYGLHP